MVRQPQPDLEVHVRAVDRDVAIGAVPHQPEGLAARHGHALPEAGLDPRQMRVERVHRRADAGMFQHHVTAVVALPRVAVDVAHDAVHRRRDLVARLTAGVARDGLEVEALVELRAVAAHGAEKARGGFPRGGRLHPVLVALALGPGRIGRRPADLDALGGSEWRSHQAEQTQADQNHGIFWPRKGTKIILSAAAGVPCAYRRGGDSRCLPGYL